MFISSKDHAQLGRSLNALHDVKTMASATKPTKTRKKYTTEQQRAKRRAYAKKYYDKKRAEQAQATITPTPAN